MLTIRPEQFTAFQSVAEADFEHRILEHLREHHADETVRLPEGDFTIEKLSDERMLELIRYGLKRARGYGTTWESSLTSFVVLMFVVAPNFDEQPAIKEVLKDESIEANLRIEEVWEKTSENDWNKSAEQYNREAWFF